MARSQVLNWLIVLRMDKSITIQASSCIITVSAQDLASLAIRTTKVSRNNVSRSKAG